MEKQNPTIKIFVTYKDRHTLLKSDVFVPIQTGRAIANEVFEEMIGDDTGDNISHLNPYFCELTAMYWAWKNYDKIGNPDYVGFMHYRRHLSFDVSRHYVENIYGLVSEQYLDENYIKKFCLDKDSITQVCAKSDIITVQKFDVRQLNVDNMYNHYKKSSPYLHIEDYDTMLNVLGAKYPDYVRDAKDYNKQNYGYFTNIFIMKKDIFFQFCEWYFDVLLSTFTNIKNNSYSIQEMRQIGYCSEWLFGIYLTHIKRVSKYSILELQRTFIDKPNYSSIVSPKFDNKQAICLASDENYALYAATTIQSIIANANTNTHYEIVILSSNISPETKVKIQNLSHEDNIQISFFDIDAYMAKYHKSIFKEFAHFSSAIYYRLFIPEIFKDYAKVCYLDCDLVLTEDISKLLDVDLNDKAVAAVADTEMIRIRKTDSKWDEYLLKSLKLKTNHEYFNSGVMLFNISQCRKRNMTQETIKLLQTIPDLRLPDQDVLNVWAETDVLLLNLKWNYEWHLPLYDSDYLNHLPAELAEKYLKAKYRAAIIHYAGGKKPWIYPQLPLAEYWWKYARKTPFYEEILLRMNMAHMGACGGGKKFNKSRAQILFKRRLYRILKHLTTGQAHKKFKKKYNRYNQLYKSL